MSDVFDEKGLLERVDDDLEFLEETVAMLDEDSPELLQQIKSAVGDGDAAALVKPAHALKGMLANFCAAPAETAARELETLARQENMADAPTVAERVQHETERLQSALHAFLESRQSS
jgi:HPt (histidine-containing phosphotransfer) domain-containing protein